MKSLQKQLIEKKGKVVWLASYPKSGNTWFRCFLSALLTGEVDLARLKTDGIFSARQPFDNISGIDSRLLLDNEVLNMIPTIIEEKIKNNRKLHFTKVHDAYIYNDLGYPIFPTSVSHKVIYLVRNPLDIVASFTNHNATTIDKTIQLMNNPKGYIAGTVKGLNINAQFRQLMLDWSGHVKGWIDQKNIEVILVRYEDMLHNSTETFTRIVDSLDIKVSKTAIKKAIQLSSFKKLQNKEKKTGFREKNIRSKKFFRSGKSGQYTNELTKEQAEKIKTHHKVMMKRLNYL